MEIYSTNGLINSYNLHKVVLLPLPSPSCRAGRAQHARPCLIPRENC